MGVFATFPGVQTIERAQFTLGHGITPSTGSIEFAVQGTPPARIGTLVLSDGTVGVALPGCLVDSASLIQDPSGYFTSAKVIDSRWRWKFGEIYGRYNTRQKNGEIAPDTRKSNEELVRLLLAEMRVQNPVSLAAIPEEPLPEVDWDGDNPAEELAELLELWNCRIGLDVAGQVRIWRYGVGAPAPSGGVEKFGADVDPPEAPDAFRVLFAPTRVQARLELEAVGRELDGSVVPVDELSYKPEGGWEAEGALLPNVTEEKERVYAKQSVYKWYRVKVPTGGLNIEGVGTVRETRQLLPLFDEQVETATNPETLEVGPKPVKVYGFYFVGNTGVPKNSTRDDNWECEAKFRVLTDLGVIAFDEQVVKFDEETADDPAGYKFGAAELYVDISFEVRSDETRAYHRYAYYMPTGLNNGTGPEPIDGKSEGGLKLYQKREEPNSENYTWAHLPKAEPSWFDLKAEKYLNEAFAKYKVAAGQSIDYAGIKPVPLDGLNVQVSFSVGPGGAMTSLSRSQESKIFAGASYAKRRQAEKQRRAAKRENKKPESQLVARFRNQGER